MFLRLWDFHNEYKAEIVAPSSPPFTAAHSPLTCQPQSFHHFLSPTHHPLLLLVLLQGNRLTLITLLPVILVDLCVHVHSQSSPAVAVSCWVFLPPHSHSCIDRALQPHHVLYSRLHSLAPHAVSSSLIFSFHITPCLSSPSHFLQKPAADSISGNVVHEKEFHFPKQYV